jgi:hypothetical protein
MGSEVDAPDFPRHDLHVGRDDLDLRLLNVDLEQVNSIERRQHVPQRDRRNELELRAVAMPELTHDAGGIVQKNALEHALGLALAAQRRGIALS